MAHDTTSAAAALLNQPPGEAAYQQLLPEILAIPDEAEIHINIDPSAAAVVALGSLPEIRAARPRIEEECRRFDFVEFDKLEAYTLAVNHAHMRYLAATKPKGDLVKLGAELDELRGRLLLSAKSLAAFGLLEEAPLNERKQLSGYTAIATDVQIIVSMLKDKWELVRDKTPFTLEALNAASARAIELMVEVGLRDQGVLHEAEALRIRRKAYTAFVQAYRNARKAILFVFGEEAGDEIAPSLFVGRASRKNKDSGAAQPNPAQPTPAQSGEHAVVSGAAAKLAAAAGADFAIDNSAGLPITSPFKS